MMNGPEKSDPAIVAGKSANKAEQSAAEPMEQRAGTKGNAGQQSTHRTQSRTNVSQAQERIRKAARERKKERFTALFHHITVELLEEAFYALAQNAAPSVDRRIGHCRPGAYTSPSRTVSSARSRSQPWRTRSSNGRWSRC
jgi:RNA-directed DNA polymerase